MYSIKVSQSHMGVLVFFGVAAAASLLAASANAKRKQHLKKHRRTGRALSEEEQYVAKSIHVNMPPARRMGITVDRVNLRNRQQELTNNANHGDDIFEDAMSSVDKTVPAPTPSPAPILLREEEEGSLSLSMPIKGNTNIHGSAFAGSLYSLCVLSAWYNLVCHLRATLGDNVLESATVVVKSAEIAYKKPVWAIAANEYVVATSFLSSKNKDWSDFIELLHETGKITCNISGEVSITETQEAENEVEGESGDMSTVAVNFKALLCVFLPRMKDED